METSLADLIDQCENRVSLLNNKLLESTKTVQAVQNAADHTKKSLQHVMDHIQATLKHVLEIRYEEIGETIDETVAKDLQHLSEMDKAFQRDLDQLKEIISQAKQIKDGVTKEKQTKKLNQTLMDIGKSSTDLPVVSFSFSSKLDESALNLMEEQVADLLKLSMTGSVQIVECVERPGAIIVRWDEQEGSECESVGTDASMMTEFVLQVCEDEQDNGVFHSIYEGEEMQYTMSFAEPCKMYTFRVCHHTLTGVYGPWSMTKKAVTTLSPHVWREEDCVTESHLQLYQLSNKGRTTTKVFPERSRILRSQSASYILGQHVQFKIEESGESSINDGIGFMSQNKQTFKQLTQSPNAAIMNTRGTIFVNGSPMMTKLPALKRTSVMLCHASRQSSGKLRVTFSIDDKEVTFDWSTQSEHYDALYFACGFEHTGWQVSVG